VTTIQREPPHVHVTYEAYDASHFPVAAKGRIISLAAAFTPWILAPTLLAAPQAISGPGSTMTSGGFEF
jgi:hypothetical protein